MSDSRLSPGCDYCGLPIAAPPANRPPVGAGQPQYCCLGCRIAHAIVREKGDAGANRATMTRLALSVFFTMNIMVFTFALWAYDLDATPGETVMAGSFAGLLRSICFLVSLPVLILLGVPLAENAWQQMKRGAPSTDILILVAVIAAYACSAWSVWSGSGSLYVETGCVTLVFLTLGRWFEATGRLRSTESLRQLEALLPPTVTRAGATGDDEVPLAEIARGDTLRVAAGRRIPADGVLVSPAASLDQQLVSGESWPVEAVAGDVLVGGTLNLMGDLLLRVTAGPGEGTLARLVAAVREARLRQGPRQRLADRLVRAFFPIIVLIAFGTLIAHWLLTGFAAGLLAALSVLLIACPCALGIATPLAIWVALGTAARRGIVISSGELLERLATAKAIRFDKTGTLTSGVPSVRSLLVAEGVDRAEVQFRARLLARRSTHVFSQAIAEHCRSQPIDENAADLLVTTIKGRGVSAHVRGEVLPTLLGSRRFMSEFDFKVPGELESSDSESPGSPMVFIGWNGIAAGLFLLEEQLRPEIRGVIAECRELGLDVGVLTGDHCRSGARLARELGVPVQAELDPQQKIDEIEQARDAYGSVIMIGDGLNDAGACVAADVGVALGCGADVTRDSAGVCLVSNELRQIPWLLGLARRTVVAMRRNILWSFGYNSLGVALAATGWLHPAVAAILMVGSSLYVIGNSLRLAAEPGSIDAEHGDHRNQTATDGVILPHQDDPKLPAGPRKIEAISADQAVPAGHG